MPPRFRRTKTCVVRVLRKATKVSRCDSKIREKWSPSFQFLQDIFCLDLSNEIHKSCLKYGSEGNYVNYVKGANIAGFVKVADAMIAQGVV